MPEPLVIAGALASIVGLLGQFESGRQVPGDDEYRDFMEWLARNNHSEIKQLIEHNITTVTGVKSILHQDREVILDRLGKIDELLARVAGHISGFGDVAGALYPQAVVSEQARSILRQTLDSGSDNMIELRTYGGLQLILNTGQIEYEDAQFIEDDLQTLIDSQLLRLDHNDSGGRVLYITRTAKAFIEASAT